MVLPKRPLKYSVQQTLIGRWSQTNARRAVYTMLHLEYGVLSMRQE